jgi:hypothetical protein
VRHHQVFAAIGRIFGQQAGKPAEGSIGEGGEKAVDELVDQSIGKPIGEVVGKAVGNAAGEATGKRVAEAVRSAINNALVEEFSDRPVPLDEKKTTGPGLWLGTVGTSVRASATPDDWPEDLPVDARAKHLLAWLASAFPKYAGHWVAYPDLKVLLFPRYQREYGCRRPLDSVIRGMNRVTVSRKRDHLDRDGKRRTVKEYLVPKPRAAVVDLEEEKRKRVGVASV